MIYVARMNTWVHNSDFPISRSFASIAAADVYIQQALDIYPYVTITLHRQTDLGKSTFIAEYKRL